MSFGVKTNEVPGTRATARFVRVSAYKAREVLNLIRGRTVADADEMLDLVERDVATLIRKVLDSAVANAEANDDQDPERLYVSACYADEGPTMKRWRPRARGRATTIRKRTSHITVIVSRLSDAEFAREEARNEASPAGGSRRARVSASRAARVAKSRAKDVEKAGLGEEDTADAEGAEVPNGKPTEAGDDVDGAVDTETSDEVETSTDDDTETSDEGETSTDDDTETVDETETSTDEAEPGQQDGDTKERD